MPTRIWSRELGPMKAMSGIWEAADDWQRNRAKSPQTWTVGRARLKIGDRNSRALSRHKAPSHMGEARARKVGMEEVPWKWSVKSLSRCLPRGPMSHAKLPYINLLLTISTWLRIAISIPCLESSLKSLQVGTLLEGLLPRQNCN